MLENNRTIKVFADNW